MGVSIDLDPSFCRLPKARRNLITDVPGIGVGHVTVDRPAQGVHTGVTAIVPPGDCFSHKLPAAAYVSNGFGKSMGLIQVNELGSLETPILLSNTFACGACFDALVDYTLQRHSQVGTETSTVNPVVLECNDGAINSIRTRSITAEDGLRAIRGAGEDFAEGDVGAGRGMTCFGLKGGIGSSSRVLRFDNREFTLGVLTMTNFGSLECLRVAGSPVGSRMAEILRQGSAQTQEQQWKTQDGPLRPEEDETQDKGSIVAVIATDMPLDARQLHRLCKRVTVGIARCGGYVGNGSGELVVAFSTANRIEHWAGQVAGGAALPYVDTVQRLSENAMDVCFRAVASASEEAIISSLTHAHTTVGRDGQRFHSLIEAARICEIPLFGKSADHRMHDARPPKPM